MTSGLWLTVTAVPGVLALALLVALVLVVRATRAGRARWAADLDELRARLDELTRQLDEPAEGPPQRDGERQYLITSLPREVAPAARQPAPAADPVTGREFASLAAGESLVRLLSLAHGVRRALSPEQRHRIRFEIRREVRRARKQRRRDLKEAKRHLRTHVGEAA